MGLVLPSMNADHGLPLKWLPHHAQQAQQAKGTYDANSTGLMLDSMARYIYMPMINLTRTGNLWTHTHTHARAHTHMHVHMSGPSPIHTHAHARAHFWSSPHTPTHARAHTHAHAHAWSSHTHTHTHARTHLHVHMSGPPTAHLHTLLGKRIGNRARYRGSVICVGARHSILVFTVLSRVRDVVWYMDGSRSSACGVFSMARFTSAGTRGKTGRRTAAWHAGCSFTLCRTQECMRHGMRTSGFQAFDASGYLTI